MKDRRLVQIMAALTLAIVLTLLRIRKRPQRIQTDTIKLEVDDKTGTIGKMTLPADLPVEQRVIALIPFIDSMRGAIKKLEDSVKELHASSRRLESSSRHIKYLTLVLVGLTIALIILMCRG